ncbi:hypothetical protein CJ014_22405 [Pleomorphomonas carboxyditropha]|uniref:Uncharacterized protein n=2 Tax=Pleomorphomonas carboxyditropha TaxID=2023338 RepID=A0A2G9WQW2_9HYPH|nr:hypothetical protein CJ014_22405 [Pleomorphomonas carboxyditropha]
MIWEARRKAPEPLPYRQIVALSGILYRDLMAPREEEPGEAKVWMETLALLGRLQGTEDGLERWYGSYVDNLFLENGIVTDAVSRQRLIAEVDRTFGQVSEQQLKHAGGDYSPDPNANRFPQVASTGEQAGSKRVSIRSLFALWERDHLADGKSARTVGDSGKKSRA